MATSPIGSVTRGKRRQQRERLERRHRVAALQRLDRHVEHGQMVGHEEGVELRRLKRLREALQMGEIEIGVGIGAGIAPGAGVEADRAHEGAEPQLPILCHWKTPDVDERLRSDISSGSDGFAVLERNSILRNRRCGAYFYGQAG